MLSSPIALQLEVPGIPLLSRGSHRRPEDGACFMELVSLLAGERWGDHPSCAHPVVAAVARAVNDLSSDGGRQLLYRSVPDVIGTGGDGPPVTAELVQYCAEVGLVHRPADQRLRAARGQARYRLRVADAGGRVRRRWLRATERDIGAAGVGTAAHAAAIVAAFGDHALRNFLLGAIDCYHRATAAQSGPAHRARHPWAEAESVAIRRSR